jgi:hypothetical protein
MPFPNAVTQSSARAAVDPVDAGNRVLEISGTSASLFRALSLNNGSVGTLFYRFRTVNALDVNSGSDLSVGLSDEAAPTAFGQYEAQMTFINSDQGVVFPGEIRARDAGTADLADTFVGSTWYNVWMVIDNPNDRFRVYLQGGAFASQTLLDAADGETWFTFRNTAGDGLNGNTSPLANDLVSLFLRAGNPHRGPSWVDDIYFDTGGVNLVNPVPEPSVFALALVGLAAWFKGRGK